jgi:peptidoglycan/xylan/chitin deacetylase (PgdA/CDA1 family)
MASPLRQFVRSLLRRCLPESVFLTQSSPTGNSVYLTFDDGPDPETTPAILDTLRRHQARATFFVVGRQARKHPELVRRMIAEGHTVGGHSYFHEHPSRVGAARLMREIERTDDWLDAMVGVRPRLFRPPHGKLSLAKLVRLAMAGKTIVLWNRDPKDFTLRDPAGLGGRQWTDWFRDHPCQAGDLVLLHDTSRVTAAKLAEVLAACTASGLQCEPLPG